MFEERKTTFADSGIYKKLIPFMAAHSTIGNQAIQKLELRISPKDKSKEQKQSICELNKVLYNGTLRLEQSNVLEKSVQIGYTLHFIKTKEEYLFNRCRNFRLRNKVKKQSLSIGELIRSNSSAITVGSIARSVLYKKEDMQSNVHQRGTNYIFKNT